MSDDLIRRSDAIKAIEELPNAYNGWSDAYDKAYIISTLEEVPSADRPQGEWKRRLVDNGFNADWVCSECGYRVKTDFVSFNYCPNCGARMRPKLQGTHFDSIIIDECAMKGADDE